MSDAPQTPQLERGQLYRLAWYFYLLLAIGGVVWIGLREGAIPAALFADAAGWWVDLGLGLGAGAALIAAWRLMARVSGRARGLERQLAEMLGPLEPAEILALALLSGFAEELFFRGAMQASWGWLPTTVVFAAIHTGPGPAYRMWTLFAALAGVVLGGLMLWRGNLLAPVVAHVLVNWINLGRVRAAGSAGGDDEPPGDEPRDG